ncbi:hypothetical protein U1Q18_014030 [Sarracenia purpurea var. burkii]
MFKSFWGSQEQEAQPDSQEIPTNSWYPPSVVSSSSISLPTTPSSTSSTNFNLQRPADRPRSPSHVSPAEAARISVLLKDKSVDELRKLLSNKDAYRQFLLSVDQVQIQNYIKDELQKETLQLSRENLEKEPCIMELRNQCSIIRTTELATAREKLNELQKQKEETLKLRSPVSLLHRLQDAMNETDEESEALHRKLLDGEIDLGAFVKKHKQLRCTYHRRALTHLAAKSSVTG